MIKIAAALVFTLLQVAAACAGSQEDAVRHLLHATFDKPGLRLVVDPVVVAGDHAVAGWSQGELGGRALLRKRNGAWSLVLCSGDGIKTSDGLAATGIRSSDAKALAHKLQQAERKISPERLVLFSKFEGTVMMDATGAHPSHPPKH